jgi:hypothetical protein
VFIRHLWQLKTVVFLHLCPIRSVLLWLLLNARMARTYVIKIMNAKNKLE